MSKRKHHDVRDVIGPRAMQAVRAYRALMRRVARTEHYLTVMREMDRRAGVVGARYGMTGYQVMLAESMDADTCEARYFKALGI